MLPAELTRRLSIRGWLKTESRESIAAGCISKHHAQAAAWLEEIEKDAQRWSDLTSRAAKSAKSAKQGNWIEAERFREEAAEIESKYSERIGRLKQG
ncbi:MAG: hypothetical protein AAF802_13215 [Planctomycetota bacterium]